MSGTELFVEILFYLLGSHERVRLLKTYCFVVCDIRKRKVWPIYLLKKRKKEKMKRKK